MDRFIRTLLPLAILSIMGTPPSITRAQEVEFDSTPALDSLKKYLKAGADHEITGELIVSALDELVFKDSDHPSIIEQLHQDILDIMEPGDYAKWEGLVSNKEKASYLRSFWLFRDLSLGTDKNERLEEHYERLSFARTIYSSLTSDGYDDRGRLYIKYGAPDAKQIDVMPIYKDPDRPGRVASGRSLETWSYIRAGRQLTYNFVDKIWGYLLVYHIDDILPAFLSAGERSLILHEILRTRVDLDIKYASAYTRPYQSLAELEGAFNEALREQAYEHTQIPVSLGNQFKDLYELKFSFRPALFENSTGKHTLSLAYGLKRDALRNQERVTDLQFQTLIRDSDLLDIANYKKTIAADFDEHDELIHQVQFPIVESHIYLLSDVSNPSGKQKGLVDYSIKSPRLTTQQLRISSVIFAKDIGSASSQDSDLENSLLIRNGLSIQIYPFSEVRTSDPIYLYFEIYDLDKDFSGKTNYNVEYTVERIKKSGLLSLVGKLSPFKKGKGKISVSTALSGNDSRDFVFTQLDFSQLSRGEHNLTVRIKDKVASETKEKKTTFFLR